MKGSDVAAASFTWRQFPEITHYEFFSLLSVPRMPCTWLVWCTVNGDWLDEIVSLLCLSSGMQYGLQRSSLLQEDDKLRVRGRPAPDSETLFMDFSGNQKTASIERIASHNR